ncbi:rhodanese-like domain-containing protein [Marinovum sp.]|uniref:rhodanese-like domain-containing protein n=1 Tax=Marinovum sp. TaxID=2024839 RepID=UPI002B27478D|nr:rhodanese-like domain-containing protein [Marinovum sp.]
MKGKTMSEIENWSPQQVSEALNAGEIVLIDVRTPAEYILEHIEGALLMPMPFFRAEALPTQDGKRIVLHCGSGKRSGKVGQDAIAAGVTPLAHMEGGFGAWKEAGLPYVGTDLASGAPKKMGGS